LLNNVFYTERVRTKLIDYPQTKGIWKGRTFAVPKNTKTKATAIPKNKP